MMNKIVCITSLLTFLISIQFIQMAEADFKWPSDPKKEVHTYNMMKQFNHHGFGVRKHYASKLVNFVRADLINRTTLDLNNLKPCIPSANADFLNTGFSKIIQTTTSEKEFESGFIRIESVGCIKSKKIEQAVLLYRDPKLRLEVISDLSAAYAKGPDIVCEKTKTIFGIIQPTHTCIEFKEIILENENVIALSASLMSNEGTENELKQNQPIYFREALTRFYLTKNGIEVRAVAYVRGMKVPWVGQSLARAKLMKAQVDAYRTIESVL